MRLEDIKVGMNVRYRPAPGAVKASLGPEVFGKVGTVLRVGEGTSGEPVNVLFRVDGTTTLNAWVWPSELEPVDEEQREVAEAAKMRTVVESEYRRLLAVEQAAFQLYDAASRLVRETDERGPVDGKFAYGWVDFLTALARMGPLLYADMPDIIEISVQGVRIRVTP